MSTTTCNCFSALQRAENSSIGLRCTPRPPVEGFSALQRAENSSIVAGLCGFFGVASRFSALQRAENSSMPHQRAFRRTSTVWFQCSSASRKFLNLTVCGWGYARAPPFQCSSASRKFLNCRKRWRIRSSHCSFQCSSASRKFLNCSTPPILARRASVSVLFSEPKIPQFETGSNRLARNRQRFSALQRAENSSISPTIVSAIDD